MMIKMTKALKTFQMMENKDFYQIHKKRYYEKYLGHGKPITLVGITFKYVEKKLTVEWVKEQV